MPVRKKNGSAWVGPDQAAELTNEVFDNADACDPNLPLSHRRGRPKSGSPKAPVNLRLDQDVLARLRLTGPGWQTKVNEILRHHFQLGLKA